MTVMYSVQRCMMGRACSRANAVRDLYRKFLNLARSTEERRGLRLMQAWLLPAQNKATMADRAVVHGARLENR